MNTRHSPSNARELYLNSLGSEDELSARRAAEKAGIPDDDPTWILLHEVRRACQEATRCTTTLRDAASEAATRIEVASSGKLADVDVERLALQIASDAGTQIASDDRIVGALTEGVRRVEYEAARHIRALEVAIRDFLRHRAAAPLASLAFAFALGAALCYASVWGAYHFGFNYGETIGYSVGWHAARVYDKEHRP